MILSKNIKYGSTVYTDEYTAYDSLKEWIYTQSVNHSEEKEYANGITIHVNNYMNAKVIFTSYG